MKEYEVLQESMTSCGGSKYSVKEFLEVEAESPEAWVKENGRWTILESAELPNGDAVITTGDCAGNIIRYIFTEL